LRVIAIDKTKEFQELASAKLKEEKKQIFVAGRFFGKTKQIKGLFFYGVKRRVHIYFQL